MEDKQKEPSVDPFLSKDIVTILKTGFELSLIYQFHSSKAS